MQTPRVYSAAGSAQTFMGTRPWGRKLTDKMCLFDKTTSIRMACHVVDWVGQTPETSRASGVQERTQEAHD